MKKNIFKKAVSFSMAAIMSLSSIQVFADDKQVVMEQTVTKENPTILYYEVPTEFIIDDEIVAPKNTKFTLNADKDVLWSITGNQYVKLNSRTGEIEIPYNATEKLVEITATDCDNNKTTFPIHIDDETAVIERVEFDWKKAEKDFVDSKGNSQVSYETEKLVINGVINEEVYLEYEVYPEYVADTTLDFCVNNDMHNKAINEKIELSEVVKNAYAEPVKLQDGSYSHQDYDVTERTNTSVSVYGLGENGEYTTKLDEFKISVENVPFYFTITDRNKNETIISTNNNTEYKEITLNARNELQLEFNLGNNVTYTDEEIKAVISKEYTLDTLTWKYWTGSLADKSKAVELESGQYLGFIFNENSDGTYPEVNSSNINQYKEDPFQRKLSLNLSGMKNIVTLKTPLAEPKIAEDIEEIETVWLSVSVTPKLFGDTIARKEQEIIFKINLDLEKETPSNVELDIERDNKNGVYQVEAETELKLNNVKIEATDYFSETGNDYKRIYHIRKAAKLEALNEQSFTENKDDVLRIGNELGFYEVQVELRPTTIGKKYGLDSVFSESYYFEVIPNTTEFGIVNKIASVSAVKVETLYIDYHMIDIADDFLHMMLGQKIEPEYSFKFSNTYEFGFGGLNPVENKKTKYGDNIEDYTESGLIWFTSSNEEIAEIDENGIITSKKPGIAYISMKSMNDEATIKLVVSDKFIDITEMRIVTADAVNIKKEKNKWQVDGESSFKLDIQALPNDAVKPEVEWRTSDESIATVDSLGNVTTHKAGTVEIKATLIRDKAVTATKVLEVLPVYISSIDKIYVDSFYENSTNLVDYGKYGMIEEAQKFKLKVDVGPDNATEKKLLTWSSSDETVAAVDGNGVVTSIKAGNTIIKAASTINKNVYAEYTLIVTSKSTQVPSETPTPSESEKPSGGSTEAPKPSTALVGSKGKTFYDVIKDDSISLNDAQQILKYALKIDKSDIAYTLTDAQKCLKIALKIDKLEE